MLKAWLPINHLGQKGFSVVEVLLAATVFGLLAISSIGALVYGSQATSTAGDRTRATMLAEEGIDSMRNIRDAGFANLTDGTYGLVQNANQWVTSGSSDTDGIFTRQVIISTIDDSRKNVKVIVSWENGTISRQMDIDSLLTNWRVDITLPTSWENAITAGSLPTTSNGNNRGLKVATQGNYAYMVMQNGAPNFYIFNISDPDTPTQVASFSVAAQPTNIAVSGDYAYVSTTNNSAELQIIDITDPASPTIVSTFNALGNGDGNGLVVSGEYAYLALNRQGNNSLEFQAINVSDPSSPTLAGSYSSNDSFSDVCISGNNAFLTSDSNDAEVRVLDVSNPAILTLVSTLDLDSNTDATAVYCSDDTLYVAQGDVLRVVNISNPTALTVSGSLTATGSATINDISMKPNYNLLFLATDHDDGELQIVDVSNPAAMAVVRLVDMTGGSILNGIAYNSMLDAAVGASNSSNQQFILFKPN